MSLPIKTETIINIRVPTNRVVSGGRILGVGAVATIIAHKYTKDSPILNDALWLNVAGYCSLLFHRVSIDQTHNHTPPGRKMVRLSAGLSGATGLLACQYAMGLYKKIKNPQTQHQPHSYD
jgi:hypothetical protein